MWWEVVKACKKVSRVASHRRNSHQSSARNKDQNLVGRFLKKACFISYYTAVSLKMSKYNLVGQMLKLLGKWPMADYYF